MAATINKLSNGIAVIIDHEEHTKCAAMGVHVGVGARYETAANNGAAHFLEHMAFKGTKKHPGIEIKAIMADLGASPNATTSHETTSYFMSGLAEDAPTFAHLLGDIVSNSVLPADELEKERGAIISEIGGSKDDAMRTAYHNAMMTSFPGQPMGATVLGPVENIKKMSRDDLKAFMDEYYHAGNIIVSAAGNVDSARILDQLEKELGHLPALPAATTPAARFVGGNTHEERPTNNLTIVANFKAAAYGEKDYWPTKMLSAILGGGMSSRLFTEIRDKRGLVYGVGAGYDARKDIGNFLIQAGTSSEKAAELMEVLCDELNKMRTTDVTDRELQRVKAKAKVEMAQVDDSMSARMNMAASNYGTLGRVASVSESMEKISAVTPAQIRAAAERIFSGTLNLSTVGQGDQTKLYLPAQKRLSL